MYEGPLIVAENIETLYSDSATLRVRLTAPLQLEYQNGDRDFPTGIYIEFFQPDGQKSTTLRADSAHYDKATDLHTAVGDVVVIDLVESKQLNSEELHWNQREGRVFTDVFVRIQTAEEVLMGEGLTAAQDFSTYRILRPKGTFSIDPP